jgi:hypothetical protein
MGDDVVWGWVVGLMGRGGIHRMVRHEHAMDYVLLGWLPLDSLDGTVHGAWSIHMVWLCPCTPVEPARD